ncbi:uncharacterized protein LOC121371692 [Gigantopelta aegis]|uniref:uncharacterized protein LOC121371692 n=1 Tax=Gigantopelta aegis TaxID=1735272 RepID=UPI001B88E176|nr:uncharacterized protein LOC121371692 [Gigantopelta aegis]
MKMPTVWVSVMYTLLQLAQCDSDKERNAENKKTAVKEALDYVHKTTASSCTPGTGNMLEIVFNYSSFRHIVEPGIQTSNYLSMIISIDNNFNRLDDNMFYSLVRSNIHGEHMLYGSSIGIKPGVYDKHHMFCPYACKQNNTVVAFDIAENYDYRSPNNTVYYDLKVKDFSKVPIIEDRITFKY